MLAAIVITAVALLSAGCMGFAIQRGATCTVAAVGEIVDKGTAFRLAALLEAALWVAGGLLLARSFGLTMTLPSGVAVSGWTIAGGLLLGLGAWLNRACVFGAIARLGSGEWAYAATPLGFLVGAITVPILFAPPVPVQLTEASMLSHLPSWLGWLLAPLVALRLTAVIGRTDRTIWHPHEATVVIGVTFLVLFLIAGPWAFTELLSDAAKGMVANIGFRSALFAALLAGAWLGGWTAGSIRSRRISVSELGRCFGGGMLMGWGSLLLPGGNDGLILVGMPLLHPYAWLGIAAMCTMIALAMRVERRWA